MALAVGAEGLAEAPRQGGAAQAARDVGKGGAAQAVGHHQAGAAGGGLDAVAELGQAGLELAPRGGAGEQRAGVEADALGERGAAGAPGLLGGALRRLRVLEVLAAEALQAEVDLDAADLGVGAAHVAARVPDAAVPPISGFSGTGVSWRQRVACRPAASPLSTPSTAPATRYILFGLGTKSETAQATSNRPPKRGRSRSLSVNRTGRPRSPVQGSAGLLCLPRQLLRASMSPWPPAASPASPAAGESDRSSRRCLAGEDH